MKRMRDQGLESILMTRHSISMFLTKVGISGPSPPASECAFDQLLSWARSFEEKEPAEVSLFDVGGRIEISVRIVGDTIELVRKNPNPPPCHADDTRA